MSSRGRNVFIVLILVGLVVATGFALSRGTLPPADYTFANMTEIETLDPAKATGIPDGRIISALFEGLCSWHPETVAPVPGVAERWDISEDQLHYTFHLRPDALWSDGTPVTAHDFEWSFQRFLHPGTAAKYAYEMWYVVGGEKYNKAEVDVGDRVEIELLERPKDALPFAAGTVVKGRLLDIDPPKQTSDGQKATDGSTASAKSEVPVEPEDSLETAGGKKEDVEAVYTVEVDGHRRRFRKGNGDGTEDYRWLLLDFDEVGIRATDERTLEIELRHPVPYLLSLMGFYPMSPVNRRCVETYGSPDWLKPKNIVTNGAFRLQIRRIRDRFRLVKSGNYWDRENVKLNVVDALPVESETTALNMYLTGQVDYIDVVPNTIAPDLLDPPRPDLEPAPYLGTYYYRVNVTRKPLDDARVRRALALAIDRAAIVERVTRAGQKPAYSFVPEDIRGYLPYQPAYFGEYDVAEARRLLAEAGYPNGQGFPKLDVLYNTQEAHEAIAQVLQSQWKRNLGIDVRLDKQEWGAYLSRQQQLDYDIARAGWIGDYTDPTTFLKMFVTDGGNNQTGWGNPEYDRLLEEAQHQADQKKRLELFHQAEQILMDEMPIMPIYYYVSTNMFPPYVHGVYRNILNHHPLKGVWIDQDEKARFKPFGPFPTTFDETVRKTANGR